MTTTTYLKFSITTTTTTYFALSSSQLYSTSFGMKFRMIECTNKMLSVHPLTWIHFLTLPTDSQK